MKCWSTCKHVKLAAATAVRTGGMVTALERLSYNPVLKSKQHQPASNLDAYREKRVSSTHWCCTVLAPNWMLFLSLLWLSVS